MLHYLNYHFANITNTLFFISNQCQAPATTLLVFSRILGVKVALRLFSTLTKQTNFKCTPVVFQHLALAFSILLVKDESSFYEIHSLAICINIKTFFESG